MRIARMCAVATVLALAGSLQAEPLTGTLNITGTATITNQSIDFLPAGRGFGIWTADPAAQSGSFATFATGSGSVRDLGQATVPVGTAFSLANFIGFLGYPTVDLRLTFINPGVFTSASLFAPPAVGQTATPPASLGNFNTMYNMVNLPGPSTVFSFAVAGSITDGITSELTPLIGNFTMQFSDTTMQGIWASLSAGGSVTTSFSASFAAAAPEPATIVLLLAGSLLIVRRRWSVR